MQKRLNPFLPGVPPLGCHTPFSSNRVSHQSQGGWLPPRQKKKKKNNKIGFVKFGENLDFSPFFGIYDVTLTSN